MPLEITEEFAERLAQLETDLARGEANEIEYADSIAGLRDDKEGPK